MSKISSLELLVQEIQKDYSWRIRELSFLRGKVTGVQSNPGAVLPSKVYIRTALLVLYAHWEGFLKYSAEKYLEYVSSKSIKYSDLNYGILSLKSKIMFGQLREAKRHKPFLLFADYFINQFSEDVCTENFSGLIETGDNLNSYYLKDIIEILDLDYSKFELKERMIDSQLVGYRNKIAHGEEFQIEYSDFVSLYDEVLDMLNLYKEDLLDKAQKVKLLSSRS